MPKNVYVHIPFCKSKCHYCSFVSFPSLDGKSDYLNALAKEIEYYYKNETLETLYLGGGTPSLLSPEEICKIANKFNINKSTEFTVELNPDDINEEYLKKLFDCRVNRLSIGCQTFDDKILKLINRRHNSKQVFDAVNFAQKIGFKNISLDFIYGLPTQSIEDFCNDLKTALKLGVNHISLYGLKIDEECYFYKNPPENLPDEDIQADMYLAAVDLLKNFNHYEISNFGLPSKHNLNYWNNGNYYGFGVSAHGYVNNVRYSNSITLEKYLNNPISHETELELNLQQRLEEEIFLGLRKIEGINISEINKKFNIDFKNKYRNVLSKYKKYFTLSDDYLSLNINGILVSNTILAEFIE